MLSIWRLEAYWTKNQLNFRLLSSSPKVGQVYFKQNVHLLSFKDRPISSISLTLTPKTIHFRLNRLQSIPIYCFKDDITHVMAQMFVSENIKWTLNEPGKVETCDESRMICLWATNLNHWGGSFSWLIMGNHLGGEIFGGWTRNKPFRLWLR